MSDTDDIDMDDGESSDAGGKKKKGGALGALLPTILKFAAIGIGALIFIVTVVIITVNIMGKDGKTQTVTSDPSSPYLGKRPIYTYYDGIGQMTTKTKDTVHHTVTVIMHLGYDQEDAAASSELSQRRFELRDFVRSYFTGKYAEELLPENEERLKQDIKEILNTRFLDTGKVRIIVFDKLDVMEVY